MVGWYSRGENGTFVFLQSLFVFPKFDIFLTHLIYDVFFVKQ